MCRVHGSELGAVAQERLVLRFPPTEREHLREQHLNAGGVFMPSIQ